MVKLFCGASCVKYSVPKTSYPKGWTLNSFYIRDWSLCEIMDQAGAGFHKPGQQQMLLFPMEAGQDDFTNEISSPGA